MVISGSEVQEQQAVPVQREPLKALRPRSRGGRRRGLSAFYVSKSQSFNCMSDLASNPFSRSALVLAKKHSLSQPSWQQPFSSIQEDLQNSNSGSPRAAAAMAATQAAGMADSWDGGCCAHSAPASPGATWLDSPASPPVLQLQQPWPHSAYALLDNSSCSIECSPTPSISYSPSLSPSLTTSNSLSSRSSTADEVPGHSAGAMEEPSSCGWYDQVPTDSLCQALQGASLAGLPGTRLQLV